MVAAALVLAAALRLVAGRRHDADVARRHSARRLARRWAAAGRDAARVALAADEALTGGAVRASEPRVGPCAIAAFVALATGAWATADAHARIARCASALASARSRRTRPRAAMSRRAVASLHRPSAAARSASRSCTAPPSSSRSRSAAGGFGIFDLDLASGADDRHPAVLRAHRRAGPQRRLQAPRLARDRAPRGLRAVVRASRPPSAPPATSSRVPHAARSTAACAGSPARGEVLRDADGQPARLIGTITDVTERKHLEESLAQTTDSLSIAQTGGGHRDHGPGLRPAAGSARTTSTSFWDCPRRRRSTISTRGSRSVHPDDLERVRRAPFETTPENPSYRCDYRLQARGRPGALDRREGRRDARADGEILRIAGALIDITDLKRTEAALDLDREAPRTHDARHARRRVGIRRAGRTSSGSGRASRSCSGFGTGELGALARALRAA